MNCRMLKALLFGGLLGMLLSAAHGSTEQATGDKLDATKIADASGSKTTVNDDGVVRIGWPRTDVKIKVDGMPFHPPSGLGSWAAFKATERGAMVMGDTVVFQDEVTPAMDAAFANGLEVTALHNHFFFDEPKVYFMHIGGTGHPEKLAASVKKVWDAIKQVRRKRPQPATQFPGRVPTAGKIDSERITKILGRKVSVNSGVVKVVIGRKGTMHGTKIAGSMGLTTWATFTGSDEQAALAGDFIMTAKEVQLTLRAMRKAKIHVVALHNHMVGERPAFYFTHFWAKGSAMQLARAFKSVVDVQKKRSAKSANALPRSARNTLDKSE